MEETYRWILMKGGRISVGSFNVKKCYSGPNFASVEDRGKFQPYEVQKLRLFFSPRSLFCDSSSDIIFSIIKRKKTPLFLAFNQNEQFDWVARTWIVKLSGSLRKTTTRHQGNRKRHGRSTPRVLYPISHGEWSSQHHVFL